MDFNEFWENGCFGEYHDIYAKNLADKFYQAGQQSKQEEVNKLQVQLDKLQAEIDALKAKANDALEAFNDGAFNYCQKQLEEILK